MRRVLERVWVECHSHRLCASFASNSIPAVAHHLPTLNVPGAVRFRGCQAPGMFDHIARGTGEVFVLGAGFSRALSPEMPLTDEMGSQVAARLGLDLKFDGGAFRALA